MPEERVLCLSVAWNAESFCSNQPHLPVKRLQLQAASLVRSAATVAWRWGGADLPL